MLFRSRTDTEVVLHAYSEWGEECLKRLNGMFAFAIWDRHQRELFIARDRYGIKPVYHVMRGSTLIFGSEVKAILAHPSYQCRVDRKALLEYFTFQNIFTDRTLFEGVRLLPAGTYLRIPQGHEGRIEPRRYWDFHFSRPDDEVDDREYEEELIRLFKQAVNRQLISDVEIGSYLSGGMDSGSIVALHAHRRRPLHDDWRSVTLSR